MANNSTLYISSLGYGEDNQNTIYLKDPEAIVKTEDTDIEGVLNFANGFVLFDGDRSIEYDKDTNTISFGPPEEIVRDRKKVAKLDHFEIIDKSITSFTVLEEVRFEDGE